VLSLAALIESKIAYGEGNLRRMHRGRQARFLRHIENPPQARPAKTMAQAGEGSGTNVASAARK
jgi:hypothetical protein